MRISNIAAAADGCTVVLELDTSVTEKIMIGILHDSESAKLGRQLFVGNHSTGEVAEILTFGSERELEIIGLLEEWREVTQGFLRRESLLNCDPVFLSGQDLLDREGLRFLERINRRPDA